MVAANAPLTPPPGHTLEDLETWSFACATGAHAECVGKRLNPDPDCPADQINQPCDCTVCAHRPPRKAGRPRAK
ncbi:hypothetical protein GCM10027187_40530 [Streptosporangium sandarakinum]|uniref:Uncharacterized protein n=1 Tax=Streptosporangium sandarakinum TaxID=1260955 RepID=A0A852V465_9ACTN|nr:hypothetical protein [Streptosporangium sandarakinum]NYF44617.1 hypothetical protein [Streptosporangium sandarakinum]